MDGGVVDVHQDLRRGAFADCAGGQSLAWGVRFGIYTDDSVMLFVVEAMKLCDELVRVFSSVGKLLKLWQFVGSILHLTGRQWSAIELEIGSLVKIVKKVIAGIKENRRF